MAHIVQIVAIDGPDSRCDRWRVLSATIGDATAKAVNATATNLSSAVVPNLAVPVAAPVPILVPVAAPVAAA